MAKTKTATRRSTKKAGRGKRGTAKRSNRGGVARATALTVNLKPAINAVGALREQLTAGRTKSADRVRLDKFLDAARAFLSVTKCQDKVMTRTF